MGKDYTKTVARKSKAHVNLVERRCFVVSPIGCEGSEIRQRADKILRYVIGPICRELGFEVVRADEIPHAGLISRKVMQELLTSDLVVADLTGANPNVYYELAVRHFSRMPVVQIIQRGEKIPFDVSDINTITIDHTDLDSVHQAKEKLKIFIQSCINSASHENPVSIALDALGITVQGTTVRGKPLLEQFEILSNQIKEELSVSRNERELLWKKLAESKGANFPLTESKLSNTDLTGLWRSNLGLVRLIQDGESVFGSYQFGSPSDWVGIIRGKIVKNRVVFDWQWLDHRLSGIGYWHVEAQALHGYWFYGEEIKKELKEYQADPQLFDLNELTMYAIEERNWYLTRENE